MGGCNVRAAGAEEKRREQKGQQKRREEMRGEERRRETFIVSHMNGSQHSHFKILVLSVIASL